MERHSISPFEERESRSHPHLTRDEKKRISLRSIKRKKKEGRTLSPPPSQQKKGEIAPTMSPREGESDAPRIRMQEKEKKKGNMIKIERCPRAGERRGGNRPAKLKRKNGGPLSAREGGRERKKQAFFDNVTVSGARFVRGGKKGPPTRSRER